MSWPVQLGKEARVHKAVCLVIVVLNLNFNCLQVTPESMIDCAIDFDFTNYLAKFSATYTEFFVWSKIGRALPRPYLSNIREEVPLLVSFSQSPVPLMRRDFLNGQRVVNRIDESC